MREFNVDRRSFLRHVAVGAAGLVVPSRAIVRPAAKVFDMGRASSEFGPFRAGAILPPPGEDSEPVFVSNTSATPIVVYGTLQGDVKMYPGQSALFIASKRGWDIYPLATGLGCLPSV